MEMRDSICTLPTLYSCCLDLRPFVREDCSWGLLSLSLSFESHRNIKRRCDTARSWFTCRCGQKDGQGLSIPTLYLRDSVNGARWSLFRVRKHRALISFVCFLRSTGRAAAWAWLFCLVDQCKHNPTHIARAQLTIFSCLCAWNTDKSDVLFHFPTLDIFIFNEKNNIFFLPQAVWKANRPPPLLLHGKMQRYSMIFG